MKTTDQFSLSHRFKAQRPGGLLLWLGLRQGELMGLGVKWREG